MRRRIKRRGFKPRSFKRKYKARRGSAGRRGVRAQRIGYRW